MDNRLDRITDGIKGRLYRINSEIHSQNKNSNPYRQEPVSEEEQIKRFLNMSPETEQRLREEGIYDNYAHNMNVKILRRNGYA